jgi:hypothetical protein
MRAPELFASGILASRLNTGKATATASRDILYVLGCSCRNDGMHRLFVYAEILKVLFIKLLEAS